MEDEYPVFHITCITHRKDPVYAAHHRGQTTDGRRMDGESGGNVFFCP